MKWSAWHSVAGVALCATTAGLSTWGLSALHAKGAVQWPHLRPRSQHGAFVVAAATVGIAMALTTATNNYLTKEEKGWSMPNGMILVVNATLAYLTTLIAYTVTFFAVGAGTYLTEP